jgi:uncharacterized membrane protein
MEIDNDDLKEKIAEYAAERGGKDITLSGVLLALLVLIIVITIYVLAFQYGWNMSMHEVFDQKQISFSNALGLLIVVFILGIVFFRR